MKYTSLGRSGLKVSKLCLGTMSFGDTTDKKEAFNIMDCALANGINFFDTANEYGKRDPNNYYHRIQRGITEEIIGEWFAQGGNRRERTVLATKVYYTMEDPLDGPNDVDGLSAYKIRRHLDASLKRLQTDHVDLYQMHHSDRNVTWEEIWGAFEPLVNSGKITYVGSSNFAAHDIMKAQWKADKRNFLGLVSEQHRYNPLYRQAELEMIPTLKELGMGLLIWGPLCRGQLAGIIPNDASPELRKKLEDYSALCHDFGVDEATMTQAWLLQKPEVTCVLTGAAKVEHLEKTLKALDVVLPENVLKRIDEIFPPFGEAPESYIW